jgi:Predicted membrane protein (DUF2142)
MGFRERRVRAARSPLPAGRARDARALATLVVALLALAGAIALVLSHTAVRRSGTDGVWLVAELDAIVVAPGATACQGGELLPAGTSALRIPVERSHGAATVTLWWGGHRIARVAGRVGAGMVRADIPRATRDLGDVRVCLELRSGGAILQGETVPGLQVLRIGRGTAQSSMAVDFLQPGRPSWWSEIRTVASRVDLGRGDWGGGWAVWPLAALLAASLALAAWVVARAIIGDRASARTGLAIMAIAACNAAAWSILTPAFQAPDEGGHIAYVQSIGETGAPPRDPRETLISPELMATMAGTRLGGLRARTARTAVWSPLQQRVLSADLHAGLSRESTIFLGPAEPEPPLYYALEAIPYELGSSATLLDRIALMRLASALLAGVTALLAFLFVRECLPARPWAWAVGGLGVAFTPMLGFVSGSVNPDALLCVLAAGLFLCLARAWRRRVTPALALWTGGLIALGTLSKVNFYALVPGALLALALAARRSEGAWNRRVVRVVAAAAGVATAGFVLGTGFEVLIWHRPFVVGRPPAPESHVSLLSHLSYIWQVFLPRLPLQVRAFPNYPAYDQLFKTFAGVFGPLAVWFPAWAYRVGALALAATGLLAARTLAADPRTLRWRRFELLGYVAIVAGLLAVVGLSADLRRSMIPILQGRYLLPLLPLFGALLALGARGAGERWGRALGVAIVVAAVGWTLFGQLLTVAFYYS